MVWNSGETIVRAAVPLAVLALVVTGCGGGASTPPIGAAPGTPAAQVTAAGPPTPGSPQESPPRPRLAAADVIRTRIAQRDSGGGAPPASRPALVVVVRGGLASAPAANLTWLQSTEGGFEYDDAVSYCGGLETAGFDDWRVPSIDELALVVDADSGAPWLDRVVALWSATPHLPRGVETLELAGHTRSHQEVGLAHVVCVRTGGAVP